MRKLLFSSYNRIFSVFSLVLLLCISGCGKTSPIVRTSFAFDTVVSITYYAKKDAKAVTQVMDRLEYYENIFSRTNPESELYQVNAKLAEAKAAGTSPVKVAVSLELYRALSLALEYAKKTGGAFDPTLGRLLELYDFSGTEHTVPTEAERTEILSHCGFEKLHVLPYGGLAVLDAPSPYPCQLTVDDPDLVIDLGGMAKGYIADCLKAELLEAGVKSAIINLGGNILVLGEKPDGNDYTVGVQKPEAGSSEYLTTFPLKDASAVTSGSYQRFFEKDGKLYHHLLDPETGLPAESGLKSVTVVTENSAEADILSTSLFVMGEEAARAYLENSTGIAVYFVDKTDKMTVY